MAYLRNTILGLLAICLCDACLDSADEIFSAGGEECPEGSESCPCVSGGDCDPGLTCRSNVCVALDDNGEDTATMDDGSGYTDSDTDGDSEAPDTGSCELNEAYRTVCDRPSAGTVLLKSSNNYGLHSALHISSVPVKGNTDLLFNWSDLSYDIRERRLNPVSDIDIVTMTVWDVGPDVMERMISENRVQQSHLVAVVMTYLNDDRTSERLLNFQLFENRLSPEEIMPYFDVGNQSYDPANITHMLMASSGNVDGKGVRMIQFFYLDPSSSTTTLYISDDSTTLDCSADLRSAEPLGIASGPDGLITADWGELTMDSQGLEFLPFMISEAVVAKFEDMTLCDMEKRFLELEELAKEWFSIYIQQGTAVDFASLASKDGALFQGIDDNGVWVLALYCTECSNPAPQFITVLRPCLR